MLTALYVVRGLPSSGWCAPRGLGCRPLLPSLRWGAALLDIGVLSVLLQQGQASGDCSSEPDWCRCDASSALPLNPAHLTGLTEGYTSPPLHPPQIVRMPFIENRRFPVGIYCTAGGKRIPSQWRQNSALGGGSTGVAKWWGEHFTASLRRDLCKSQCLFMEKKP